MSERIWRSVDESVVYAIHDEQLAEHGGLSGLRDKALLLSALASPHTLEAYGTPDVADLAACYAVGIARNHPFIDGNKRTALVVAIGLFLPLNRFEIVVENAEMLRVMLAVAEGTMSEAELAAWIRTYTRALAPESSSQTE